MRGGQPQQVVFHRRVLARLRAFMAVARLAGGEVTDGRARRLDCPMSQRAAMRWRYHFYELLAQELGTELRIDGELF